MDSKITDVYGMTSTLVDQIRPFLRIEDEAFDDPRDARVFAPRRGLPMDKDGAQRPRRRRRLRPFVSLGGTIDWGETERAALALSARKVAQADGTEHRAFWCQMDSNTFRL